MRASCLLGYTKGMSCPQTKTANSAESLLTPGHMHAFHGGASLFNRGDYFEAHEFWEKDWRKLPVPHRYQVQAAILTCGFFLLIGKNRLEPALRLAKLALERFREAASGAELSGTSLVLDVPGAEEMILTLIERIQLGETDPQALLAEVGTLKVSVRG